MTVLPGVIRMIPAEAYALLALQLAKRRDDALYDAVYVDVARSLAAPLITGDDTQAAIGRATGHKVFMIADRMPPAR